MKEYSCCNFFLETTTLTVLHGEHRHSTRRRYPTGRQQNFSLFIRTGANPYLKIQRYCNVTSPSVRPNHLAAPGGGPRTIKKL
jgi:hypothetical protein